MDRQRRSRSSARCSGASRIPPTRTARRPSRTEPARPGSASAQGAVLSFLSELLIGDSVWTLAEVQRLVAVRDLAELGRWRAAELDDEGASAR